MACYAALVSLIRTVENLLQSPQTSVGPETFKSALDEARLLKESIQLMDRIGCYSSADLLDGFSSGYATTFHLKTQTSSLKPLHTFESHLLARLPSEYKLVLFSRELVSIVKMEEYPIDGQTIRELGSVLESLLSGLRKEPLGVDLADAKQRIELLMQTMREEEEEEEEEEVEEEEEEEEVEEEEEEEEEVEFLKTRGLVSDISRFANQAMMKLEAFMKRLDRNRSSSSCQRLNALEGQIREAACKLQDSLESHVSTQSLAQSKHSPFSLHLLEVDQDIKAFIRSANGLREEYISELRNTSPDEEEEEETDCFYVKSKTKSKMIGLREEAGKLKKLLTSLPPEYDGIYTIVGMAGIGKTALAKVVFEDPSIRNHFDCCAWVTVGPKRQLNDILRSILAQVGSDTNEKLDEKKMVQQSLNDRAHLIVFDDVWDSATLDDLIEILPNNNDRSRVLVTTRLRGVSINDWCRKYSHGKSFMSKKESWELLRVEVFGDQPCPLQLEKYGQRIAENCDGLPLTVVTVARLLSESEQTTTEEYWKRVAMGESSVFSDAYNQMSESLFQSYRYLPQHLKACFLYMGAFPQKYEISCTMLVELLSCEELFEPIPSVNFENFVEDCLHELFTSNVIIVCDKNFLNKIKTWRLHSAFWHMCTKEARNTKFSHVINSYADGLARGIESQHRLCIHNNILLGIKDVYRSISANSNARSFLCTGPYHRYPVPICSGSRLLRVLDAHTIRLYEFPSQILELIYLRYLAITFDGNLPHSISKLTNLRCLIVQRHASIKPSGSGPYVPVEIWDMKELKHLQIVGDRLSNPLADDSVLPLLTTLLDVSADAWTRGILGRMPNLTKLGFRIELGLETTDGPPSFFEGISQLSNLKSLKCVVVNPRLDFTTQPRVPRDFSSGLKRLSLSGFGYPWKDMCVIEKLPNLQVLKLRCYAFRGPKWETGNGGFRRLDSLMIEDTDMVHWTVGDRSFNQLRRLTVKHCYKLEVIPEELSRSLFEIEVVDCSPLAKSCAKRINSKM